MNEALQIFLVGQGFTVMGSVIVAAFYFGARLTRIETDLKWIKRNCPKCPQTLDDLTK